jgi:hypothetical protein
MQIKEAWKKILDKSRPICLLLISASILFPLIFWGYAEMQGYVGIQKTVSDIKANSTDQESLVRNLLKWENENLNFSFAPLTGDINIDRILRLFYDSRPNLIFYNKRGACGEFSTLFIEMAKVAGIDARVAGTPGEDHQWNEVFINGKWVHVDPTLNPPDNFDNPHIYEKGWRWNLSKVYANYNGEQIDVTDKYAGKIGILNVTVNENNMPVENVEVVVESQFRMERDPGFYKTPLQTTYCTTTSNGRCSFYLGENNYTILARKVDLPFKFSPYLLEFEQKNITLTANSTRELAFSFPKTGLEPLRSMAYLMAGYIFIIGCFVKMNFRSRIRENLTGIIRQAIRKS